VVFWVMTPYSLICYQCFGGTCCLSLQSGTLKTKTSDSSESLVTIYQTTGCHKPENPNLNISRLNQIQYYRKITYREYNFRPISKSKELFSTSLQQRLVFLLKCLKYRLFVCSANLFQLLIITYC
jgi:hypothetical protein